jgi:hypothetical protein
MSAHARPRSSACRKGTIPTERKENMKKQEKKTKMKKKKKKKKRKKARA